MKSILFLFITLILLLVESKDRFDLSYCDGTWFTPPLSSPNSTLSTTSTHYNVTSLQEQYYDYVIEGSRTIFDPIDVAPSVAKYLKTACPAQQIGYSCYFQSGAAPDPVRELERVKMLERRRFIPNDKTTCQAFTPEKFLRLITNRHVLMLGDSVMGQTWESFACSLLHIRGVTNHVYTHFNQHRNNFRNPQLVPIPINPSRIGEDNIYHAHIMSGYITFKELNATISYESNPRLNMSHYIPEMIHKYHLRKQDIVVFNMGLHFNDPERPQLDGLMNDKRKEMEEVLFGGKEDLLHMRFNSAKRQHHLLHTKEMNHLSAPMIFVTETTPQHFTTPNGYYPENDDLKRLGCLTSSTPTTKIGIVNDWRNEALHKHFDPLAEKGLITYIPLPRGLRSQYDAHAGGNQDCTHWCFPSGIQKYFHLIYFNAFERRLKAEGSRRTPHVYDRLSMRDRNTFVNNNTFINIESQEEEEDYTWRLHPSLRNGDVVCFVDTIALNYRCFFIERGRFRPYTTLKDLEYHQRMVLINGNTSLFVATLVYPTVKFVEQPLQVGDYVLGKPIEILSPTGKSDTNR